VDAAHGLGLQVLLDVVYNHFGPHGNHLERYASGFFRENRHTPWGKAIDFRRAEVRDYFIHNALYWLNEYRFDGLRLDAVHAIGDRDFLLELAQRVRASVHGGRHVHLVLENDDNDAGLLEAGYTAQWNDDAHHVLHAALTGERNGYYADYSDPPAPDLARWLGEGFVFQGQPSTFRQDRRRGQASAALPPTAFVAFLQNHDQVGNRAFGERLSTLAAPGSLRVATALLLLSPQVPLLFMGEEWGSTQPFLYFTDYNAVHDGELAAAVREGRRREFAGFAGFSDAHARERIPDPNDPATFRDSVPDFSAASRPGPAAHQHWIATLLSLRQREIVPRLDGAHALGAVAAGAAAVTARWTMNDGQVLRIDVNLGAEAVMVADECCPRVLYELAEGQAAMTERGSLPGHALVVRLGARAT
jgi:maltooligosyltrehalose trehalohydrolase